MVPYELMVNDRSWQMPVRWFLVRDSGEMTYSQGGSYRNYSYSSRFHGILVIY
jgi:hypothetical protein